MPTFDFTPYYRSTVGFDRLFHLLDESIRSDWPPYNIERKSEDQYCITMTTPALPRTKSNWSSTGARF